MSGKNFDMVKNNSDKNLNIMGNISNSASMSESTVIKKGAGGRPKVQNAQNKKVTVNFTEDELLKIEELCEKDRTSKSQFIKKILLDSGII